MRPSKLVIKRLFGMAVAGALLLAVVTLGLIVISRFLPASTDAKCRLIYRELSSIQTVIIDCWCASGQVLPTDWSSLEAAEEWPSPNMVKDPFSGFEVEYLSQFSDKRIIVWSVGPDGMDNLDTSSVEVQGQDELVLIINQADGKLETQIQDFSPREGPSHRGSPPPPSIFAPEDCH